MPNDRLAHLVKDATRALLRALQMRLAEHGVSFGHWTFLRILWEHDGLTQRELSEQAGVMEPTTFSALKAMERLGYVARRQMPDNRKKIYVFLTPKGRALKSKLVPLAEEVNRDRGRATWKPTTSRRRGRPCSRSSKIWRATKEASPTRAPHALDARMGEGRARSRKESACGRRSGRRRSDCRSPASAGEKWHAARDWR